MMISGNYSSHCDVLKCDHLKQCFEEHCISSQLRSHSLHIIDKVIYYFGLRRDSGVFIDLYFHVHFLPSAKLSIKEETGVSE